jgi:HlyD family secretion protein
VQQAQAALAQAQTGARPQAIAAAEADIAAAEANAKAADADVAAATASLQQAQAALADTELHAPFDGTVVTVNVKQGENAPVGAFIIRLADLTQWKVQTKDLTELSVSRVRVGAAVDITFDAIPDVALTGKVTRIDNFGVNRQGDIVYAVTIAPDKLDPRMRWNMTASVRIKTL